MLPNGNKKTRLINAVSLCNSLPNPRFWIEGIFYFKAKTKNIFSRKNQNKTDGTVNGIESGTVNISLNKNEQAVYGLLGKNPYYTRQELADATSKSLRTIQRTLYSLRKKDLIERIGSDKSGYWEVKNQ